MRFVFSLLLFISLAVNNVPFSGAETGVVRGRVTNRAGQGVEGITVRWNQTAALTDKSGNYAITVPRGRRTLAAEKEGKYFVVGFQTVTVSAEPLKGVLFMTTDYGPAAPAFLDVPLVYDGTKEGRLKILKDKSDGGRVNAWFDHRFPANESEEATGTVLMYTGEESAKEAYSGHGGIDFTKTSELTGSKNPDTILAAASGTVVRVVDDQPSAGCEPETTLICGYGNYVVLRHEVGTAPVQVFYTLYGHLESVNGHMKEHLASGTLVLRSDQGDWIGMMGNSGHSHGKHLHFGVFRDDGDGKWGGDLVDRPVDPFGWQGRGDDPYVIKQYGPPSGSVLWLEAKK